MCSVWGQCARNENERRKRKIFIAPQQQQKSYIYTSGASSYVLFLFFSFPHAVHDSFSSLPPHKKGFFFLKAEKCETEEETELHHNTFGFLIPTSLFCCHTLFPPFFVYPLVNRPIVRKKKKAQILPFFWSFQRFLTAFHPFLQLIQKKISIFPLQYKKVKKKIKKH